MRFDSGAGLRNLGVFLAITHTSSGQRSLGGGVHWRTADHVQMHARRLSLCRVCTVDHSIRGQSVLPWLRNHGKPTAAHSASAGLVARARARAQAFAHCRRLGCAAQVMFALHRIVRKHCGLRQTPRGSRVGNGALASQPSRPAAEGGGRLPLRRGCQSQSLQPKRPAVFRATDDGCRMQGASDYCTALEENGDMNWSHVPALMRCIICSFM